MKPLWAHQQEAINRANALPGFALFFEMGTGKSRTAIEIVKAKCNKERRLLRTLIFCPPIVIPNWKDEWKKYSKVEPGMITLLSGSGKERLELFKKNSTKPQIFVTNYESLQMDELFHAFRTWAPEVLIFDESHRLKSHTSKRSKSANALANPGPFAPYKYILSGDPILNSPADIFQQFKILDGGRRFTDNFFSFRAIYFMDKNAAWKGRPGYFPNWVIKPGMENKMNDLINEIGMRVEKKDCLDLPPLIRTTIKVPMLPEQRRVYEDLANKYIAFVDQKAVSAPLAIVKALRLMQLASGFVPLDTDLSVEDDVVVKRFPNTPKILALKELIEDHAPAKKILVWSVWKENYAQIKEICDGLKCPYVEVHGGISPQQKLKSVAQFEESRDTRVFIGHPGSGGIGINLVSSALGIHYSRTFSLEFSRQSEARNYRAGSEMHESITRLDLVCENSIEEEAVESLINKQEMSDKILLGMVKNSLVKL